MKQKIIISDEKSKFLSEVIREIPSQCLLNKGVTGCGGTTLEIQSKRDSIILVPNVNLVLNKTAAHSNLIGVYGDVNKVQFLSQFKRRTTYKKIIATYDALPKLIDWIGDNIYDYFLLIDEYHILFNSYSLRYEAISNVLNSFREFKNYCFMTATPLNDENILEEIKDIPIIEIKWPQAVPVKATVENVYFTSKRLIELINESLKGDYNLHIFINSINTIRGVIKGIETKDFRTICSKNAANEDKKSGGKLKVESINSPVKKINFYTATAFEGVDIYDPVGKTVVVSDTNIAQSLVDISTLFVQICGRLRDSIYKDQVLFICNTNNHRYLRYKTDQDFETASNNIEKVAIKFEKEFKVRDPETVQIDLGAYNENPVYFQSKYIGRVNNLLRYDNNFKKIDKQNYKVITNLFKSTISVINNMKQSSKIEVQIDPIYKDLYNALPNKLQLTHTELMICLSPVFMKYNIYSNQEQAKVLNFCTTKRRSLVNSKTVTIYDFLKLKSLIS